MHEFTQNLKRGSNDLVFVERSEELLKEALVVFKKCDPAFQPRVLSLVEDLSLTDDAELIHRVRLLKALFVVSKLG